MPIELSLPEEMLAEVDSRVAKGDFEDRDECIRSAIRLMLAGITHP